MKTFHIIHTPPKLIRHISRLGSLLLAMLLSAGLQAQGPMHDAMDTRNLARIFLGGELREGLPPDFPTPVLPGHIDLRLLGSLERTGHQELVLESGQPMEEVLAILRQSYASQGWQDISTNNAAILLCHPSQGMIQVNTQQQGPDAPRRIHASRHLTNLANHSCEQQQQQRENAARMSMLLHSLMDVMPVLELPEGAERLSSGPGSIPALGIRGNVGINTSPEIDQDSRLRVDGMNAANLHAHFASQLQAQDWTVDSEGLGAASATSVWLGSASLPEVDGPLALRGVMTLLQEDVDQYRLMFRLNVPPGQGLELSFPSPILSPIPVPLVDANGLPFNIFSTQLVRDSLP